MRPFPGIAATADRFAVATSAVPPGTNRRLVQLIEEDIVSRIGRRGGGTDAAYLCMVQGNYRGGKISHGNAAGDIPWHLSGMSRPLFSGNPVRRDSPQAEVETRGPVALLRLFSIHTHGTGLMASAVIGASIFRMAERGGARLVTRLNPQP